VGEAATDERIRPLELAAGDSADKRERPRHEVVFRKLSHNNGKQLKAERREYMSGILSVIETKHSKSTQTVEGDGKANSFDIGAKQALGRNG
jgi:hypothetical protein